jgi:hypothetical protein
MSRSLTIHNLYNQKFETLPLDGRWLELLGEIQRTGAWLIYGAEKNGKTWLALTMAGYLSGFEKVLYVSAEEGTSKTFIDSCRRAGLNGSFRRLNFEEYVPIPELEEKLNKRKAPRIIFIDNITIYADELKNGVLRNLLKANADKLFVFLAHEENKEPYTATAKLCRRLANAILHVEGLMCVVSGRVPGGKIVIHDNAYLYHGMEGVKS